ncbi:MAG: hypothetical protein ACYCOR_05750 [Acidobacteriaceae bacterium]
MMPYDPICGIESIGYTEREASFLYLVAAHSGYFLRRQFDQFIHRSSGAIAQHFLTKAKRMGHIAVLDFGQQRHVYHLFHKDFYTLLDDPDSQNRRRKGDAEIKLRLMALDYVLLHLADNFLYSREAKLDLFTKQLGISSKVFPQSGRHSQRPFADRILIGYDKIQKLSRFVFTDEGTRSLARFEKFLSNYKRLFDALTKFELVYLSDADTNFAEAVRLFQKFFPQAFTADFHALCPKGPEHLLAYFRVRARYDAAIGGLTMENFLLLREGNLLYTDPAHEKLYQQWQAKPFTVEGLRQRVQSKSSPISFRTELLELAYPIFNYRHLSKKPPSIDSIERTGVRATVRSSIS